MLDYVAWIAMAELNSPETRQPTSTPADQGLTLVDIATLSGATLPEGFAKTSNERDEFITPFRLITSVTCLAFG